MGEKANELLKLQFDKQLSLQFGFSSVMHIHYHIPHAQDGFSY
ncbi:hypothetical protein ACFLVM_00670 [Chloroflexota bacterium]